MAVLAAESLDSSLSEARIRAVCRAACDEIKPAGKRILALVPDHTRSCPLDMLFPVLYEELSVGTRRFDCLIALGTHPPLTREQMATRLGLGTSGQRLRFENLRVFNHHWNEPTELMSVGRLTAADVRTLTDGLLECEVAVTVNKLIRAYDLLLLIGPVSGGNKYIFPGISGPELLNFFHWLGAVITNPQINGRKWTAVRRVIDRAAAMLPVRRYAFCMVTGDGGLAGLYAGESEQAWSRAADLSAKLHIRWTDRSYHTVLSCAPSMYEDLWLGGKCMYKLEPVVADGGTLIIYAPHLKELSHSHGKTIRQVGYHVRDFFLKQWQRYERYPWGVLAHCTHVKGIGSYVDGQEQPRIEVVLATGIPESLCHEVNLGYMDWRAIKLQEYQGREQEGVLYVARAGQILYRWRGAPSELGGDES